MRRASILFICSHNAARSQLAEGLMRSMFGDRFDVHSAGVEPLGVHPAVIKVLDEIGIDARGQWSKGVEEYKDWDFDHVVTVCSDASRACPFFPGKEVIHRPFDDPVITQDPGEDMYSAFRRVRDEIRDFLQGSFG